MTAQRQRTPAELLENARRLLRRLGRALDALDEGADDALDDVAAITRTVLSFGKGDKALLRLVNAFRLDHPTVWVPAIAGPRGGSIVTLLGPVPSESGELGAGGLDIFRWVSGETGLKAVTLDGHKPLTWDAFIKAYANDEGAHVGTTVRAELEAMQLFQGPVRNMAGYLVRAAGVVAERGLAHAIAQIDGGAPAADRPFHEGPVEVSYLLISTNGLAFAVVATVAPETRILSFHADGRRIDVTWVWDGVREEMLRFDSDSDLGDLKLETATLSALVDVPVVD